MNRLLVEKKILGYVVVCYFSVYGLWIYGFFNGNFVMEVVYVYSKLMIVDDCVVIIGLVNINDCSMFGDRDLEVVVIIKDNDMMEGKMN